MVEEEVWVTWRSSEVASRVASNNKVTSSVHAHEAIGEAAGRWAALERLPEGLVCRALEQGHNIIVFQPSLARKAGDITRETSGVVTEAVAGLGEVLIWVKRCAERAGKERADVDLPVLERTRSDTAAARTLRDLDFRVSVEWNAGEGLIGAAFSALTRHGRIGAIKEGRLGRVFVPPRVAIVWLITLVATFVAERLLIGPSEVAMPGQEVSCHVNVEGLLDVSGHKVVVAVPASRADIFRSL